MLAVKKQNNKNWRKGLTTTFAVAFFTATVANYAVWEEDVLTNYTYTNDLIAVDNNVYIGLSVTNSTSAAASLAGEGRLSIYDGVPTLSFVDSTNANDPSWAIGQVSNGDDYNVTWRGDLDLDGGSNILAQHVMTLESNSPENAIQTFASGNVSFADGDIYWDDTSTSGDGNLGIGTSTPVDFAILHVKNRAAITYYEGTQNGGSEWYRWNDGGFGYNLGRFSPTSADNVFRLYNDAPNNSIVANATGVGMGTLAPAASLEVERNDGTAKVLVQENSFTTDKRRMLELENNGAASMLFTNSNTGVQWELNPNANDHFIINSVGIGGTEFTLKNDTGEMFVGGRIRTNDNIITTSGQVVAQGVVLTSSRETKEEFKPVDNAEILDKVAELEITQWRFKEGNEQQHHIGPMAEDFEEAFQLGTDGKTIGVTDVNGITLASIQALNQKIRSQDSKLKQKDIRIEELEQRLIRIERLLK